MPVSHVPPSEPQPEHDQSLPGWARSNSPLTRLPAEVPTPARRPWWVWPAVTVGALAVITAIVVGVLYFATDTFEEKHGGKTLEQAHSACEDSAKDRLKSPTTAIFEFTDAVASSSGDGWDIDGRVSSENGFGAMIANGFNCHTYGEITLVLFDSDFEND